jgi:dTMP kinase
MHGKFIVLDGTDGSGKGTQTQLLAKKLEEQGYKIKVADFPQYGQPSAIFVEQYLRGEFGSSQEVKPKQASLFYALDRYAASKQIKQWLSDGYTVISNRYVSANKGHQLGKLYDKERMQDFLNWINDLEYNILKIPKPDLTIFLHISQKLVDKKDPRAYIQGKKRDIHEDDINHLQNAERAYLFCLDHDQVENWVKLICFDDLGAKPINVIHEEILMLIKKEFS